jgi:membrane-anchored glycerophosphoryl diester phosphodiesterase (GDPDase)
MKDTEVTDWIVQKLESAIRDSWPLEEKQKLFLALKQNIERVARWICSLIENLLLEMILEKGEAVYINNISLTCNHVAISLQKKFEKEIEKISSVEATE